MSSGTDFPMALDQCVECTDEADAKAIAIVALDGAMVSRGELRSMAGAVAARLVAAGLGRGDRIAVLAPQSPEAIAAFLGASMAGAVYIALDAKARPEYLSLVMREYGVRALLTDQPISAQSVAPIPVLPLTQPADRTTPLGPAIAALAGRQRDIEDGAYIMSTSGSTGRPKGVLQSHRSALTFADWAIRTIGLTQQDVLLGTAPIYFGYSAMHIYSALRQRARLVIAPEPAAMFPGLLLKAIEDHHVSVLTTVPTVLRTLLDVGAFDDKATASLRSIIYSGEPFQAPTLARLMRALPDVELFNFFGATEMQITVAHRFAAPPADDEELPIGTPVDTVDLTLLDAAGAPVVDGEIGEIAVEGPTVMKGYITSDGLHPAPRPFRTGDHARRGRDGVLYYCGRQDQQVKVRGMRVVLPAVDCALLTCAGVKEAAAFVIGDNLVACVSGDPPPPEAELDAACRLRLPSGAQPHRFVRLDAFPRLGNGKVDRLGLKARVANA